MKILARLFFTALVLLAIANYVPGVHVDDFYTAIIVAVVLGLLNIFIKPLLIILTLPITILTLGLFTFIINASLFWFTSTFVEGFTVASFWHALLGSLIVTIASSVINKFL